MSLKNMRRVKHLITETKKAHDCPAENVVCIQYELNKSQQAGTRLGDNRLGDIQVHKIIVATS